MKEKSIRREYIPFIIVLGMVFLNIPIILTLYFLAPDSLEKVASIIAPIESIIIGISIAYSGIYEINSNNKNYKKCNGTIKNFQFTLYNHKWLKTPIVSYEINGKTYEIIYDIGINGIVSFGNFLKGRKVTVYYKEDEPQNGFVNNYLNILIGTLFFVVGVAIIIYLN